MSEWKEYRLGDFIDVKHGFAFKGIHITDQPTENILVTPGNFHIGGGFKEAKFKYYNSDFPKDYILNEGDVVVTMTDLSKETDTLGYSAKIPKPNGVKYLHNQRIGLVQFKSDKINKDFIYWIMRTREYQGYIIGSASGTSIMHTAPSRIKDYSFLLPSLPEQTAIAEVLSSLDDKIDLLHRQSKTLEQLSETLFKQWFVVEADESWETVKISEVAAINKRTISKGFPFDEIEYLDTGSITEGKIESFQKYLLKDAPSRAQRLVNENDIVYSLVRPIQRHYGLLHDVKPNTVASTGFCVISCEKITPYFIYILLTQNETVEYLDMVAEGSTSAYPSLKPSDISSFEFQLPPKFKLDEFAEIAETNWNKIKSNTNQIQTLTKLRETLLPKLMSAEVRVKY